MQDVKGLFFNASSFNGDLSSWKFSPDVTDLSGMFQGKLIMQRLGLVNEDANTTK